MDNMTKIFYDDVREKKKTGYGASHRASRKKGFKGGMKLPYDMHRGKKQQNEYLKSIGIDPKKVEVYNLYDSILDKETFYALNDVIEKRKMLSYWLGKYDVSSIADKWKCNKSTVRSYAFRLGLSPDGEPKHVGKAGTYDENGELVPKEENSKVSNKSYKKKTIKTKSEIATTATKETIDYISEITLNSDSMQGEEVQTRIMKLLETVMENSDYEVTFEIKELP